MTVPDSPAQRPTSKDPVLDAVFRLIADDGVKVPPIPSVVAQLSQKLANPSCEMRDVALLVGTDQALSAHVIRCAGATLLAARAQVTSLNEAVMRVGTNGLFSLAVSFCIGREVARKSMLQSLRRDVFRKAAATAEFCRRLAGSHRVDPDSAFLCGLLGSFGLNVALVAIEQVLLGSRASTARPAAEWMEMARRVESQIGANVITQWGMPKLVAEVMVARRTGEGSEQAVAYAGLLQGCDRLAELFYAQPSPPVSEIAAAMRCSEHQAVEIASFLPSVASSVHALGSASDDTKNSRPISAPIVEILPTTLKGQLIPTSIPCTVERKGGDHQLMCTGMASDGFVAQGTQPLPMNQVVKCKLLGVEEDLELVACVTAVTLEGEYRFELKPMGLVGAHLRRWQKMRGEPDAVTSQTIEVQPARPGLAPPPRGAEKPASGAGTTTQPRSPLKRIGGWLRGRGDE